ncbi:zinc metallopeptidase [Calidifontimicrobium sp. SYSU G02091]|uniref:KPN_02809 family neutral zinc metallopeptidase n=1 Tax=Calidifontimicrobium sp. SYSU G02091 TaxID=2926421 RepID=UPI001F5315FA|nr:neutral zinc metallopeptidase [Calidifontimicrobium sp. SYSU G02091]MCI1191190.1 zinc metallopeptidase [Calidifontimicrobium sp. SYSU G02091]
MKWEGQRQSDNVEDRRAGGGAPRLGGGRGIGLGTIVVALVAGWLFGINPLTLLGLLGGGELAPPAAEAPATAPPPGDAQAAFVATVLADTEDVWGALLRAGGAAYREPRLVLYRDATRSACGVGQAAMGPFYCPADEKVYLDLGFFDTLHRRLGAPGDFAQAYVIAHEVGHHVQNLLGVTAKVDAMRGRVGEAQMNAISVRVELQADCFAGVWAHHSQRGKNWLEQGDVEEAMNAAAQIGDDTLQRRSQGRVVPDSFTHGTSAQRQRWFQRGYASGRLAQCDTFAAQSL